MNCPLEASGRNINLWHSYKWTYGLLVIAELEERRIQKVKLSDDEAAAVSVNICWLAAGRKMKVIIH